MTNIQFKESDFRNTPKFVCDRAVAILRVHRGEKVDYLVVKEVKRRNSLHYCGYILTEDKLPGGMEESSYRLPANALFSVFPGGITYAEVEDGYRIIGYDCAHGFCVKYDGDWNHKPIEPYGNIDYHLDLLKHCYRRLHAVFTDQELMGLFERKRSLVKIWRMLDNSDGFTYENSDTEDDIDLAECPPEALGLCRLLLSREAFQNAVQSVEDKLRSIDDDIHNKLDDEQEEKEFYKKWPQ